MSQPPQWTPPPPVRPTGRRGVWFAVRKSFSDRAWIRTHLVAAIAVWSVSALMLAAFFSALADPDTYRANGGGLRMGDAPAAAGTTSASPPPRPTDTSSRSTRPAPSTRAAPSRTPSTTPRTTLASSKPTRPAYPGRTDDDVVAGRDGSVRISGFTITLGPLVRTTDPDFGHAQMCAPLTLLNRDNETQSYDSSDFSIQYPNGNVKGQQLVYSGDIQSGQLVSGGTTMGRACFVDRGMSGLHVVSWSPDLFRNDRAVWLFRMP